MLPLDPPPPPKKPPKKPPPNPPPKPPLPPTMIGALPPPPDISGSGGSGTGAGWFSTVTVAGGHSATGGLRSAERRVGKEGGSMCRYWWSPYIEQKKK